PLRLLPTLLAETTLLTTGSGPPAAGSGVPAAGPGPPAAGAAGGLPFAVEEHRLEVVRLDLFEESPHLLVLGDAGCGKSSLLPVVASGLAAPPPPRDARPAGADPPP